ncbi:MAG: ketopantoate reductase family protein [Christensenellaceae bacterium]|jgi:2-dehydropantoate 2-reductase
MQIRKVSIIGLGALGVMYAAQMAPSMKKEDFRIIADKKRTQRYKEVGFYLNERLVSFEYSMPQEEFIADLVIVSVKYGALGEAINAIKNDIGENTVILSLINGISSEEELRNVFGDKVLYCVAYGMDAKKKGNRISYENMGKLCFGEKSGVISQRVKAVGQFFERTGVPYEISDAMPYMMWWKYIGNVGINQTSTMLDMNYGQLLQSGEAKNMMVGAMREVIEIGQAEGIRLSAKNIDEWMKVLEGLSKTGYPSMRQDIKAGRKTEVELFSGTIRRLGKKHGIKTPVNDLLYEKILEIEKMQ